MINFQIETDSALKEISRYLIKLRNVIVRDLQIIGDSAVERLTQSYPDANVSGQFFPNNWEYWIQINGIVLCTVTGNRINTAVEKQVGKINDANSVAFDKDIVVDSVIQDIVDEAIQKFNSSLEVLQ